LIGGIAGATLGLAGGVAGTWASIRNTRTPAARAFMIRMSALLWTVMGGALAVLLLAVTGTLPMWTWWVTLPAFFVFLGPFIAWGNHRLAQLEGPPTGAGSAAQAHANDSPRDLRTG
jgi:drug/metabolite transporter (DMT)-like permease